MMDVTFFFFFLSLRQLSIKSPLGDVKLHLLSLLVRYCLLFLCFGKKIDWILYVYFSFWRVLKRQIRCSRIVDNLFLPLVSRAISKFIRFQARISTGSGEVKAFSVFIVYL